jgi:hypothetical protein
LLRSCGVFIKGLRRRGIRRRFAGAPDIWRHFFAKNACEENLRECCNNNNTLPPIHILEKNHYLPTAIENVN